MISAREPSQMSFEIHTVFGSSVHHYIFLKKDISNQAINLKNTEQRESEISRSMMHNLKSKP